MKKFAKIWDLCSGSLERERIRNTMMAIALIMTLLSLGSWTFFPQVVQAELEWQVIKDLDLKTKPLDIAPSMDGKWLFILCPGEILIFSTAEGTIKDRIPIDKDYDRIAPLPRPDLLTITSSTKNSLQVIRFDAIYKIDLTDLPFKGQQQAPVTVAVFDDYQ